MKGFIGLALACACAFASTTRAAEVANYRFDATFASSIAGAPALQELAPFGGVFAHEVALQRNAWLFPAGSGLVLDTTGLLQPDRYSLVIQMRSALDQAYMKLVDTSDRLADHGLYFSYDDLGYYPRANGDDNELLEPNQWYTVVVTRSAAGEYRGYIDGVERFRFQDEFGETRIPASGLLHFFRDDVDTDDRENSQGGVARLRVFDVALSPAEVAALSGGIRLFRDGFEGS